MTDPIQQIEARLGRKITASAWSSSHGYTDTRLYVAWKSMKNRCNCKTTTSYKNYGAKGIKVCKEWLDFKPFMKWSLENGYKDNLTIDRIDGKGNYTPSNCRWVTKKENIQNKYKLGCAKGHPWTKESTAISGSRRFCKICRGIWRKNQKRNL
jgi:hypothetical protein